MILIKEKDIVMINHLDDKNRSSRHPFLVIETTDKYFFALQVTACKFDNQGNIVLSKFQKEYLSNNEQYFDVDINDGFKYVSWVLLNRIYKINFGENLFNISVHGEMSNYILFKKIRVNAKSINRLPISFNEILNNENFNIW
ncbi:hypothetical protein mflW37_3200 [Mesoplasma florum W37]|uniref:Uncharacterized protein n=1 Tax=Mesoplasma florum TaxID=2151 RepID=A0AAD0MQS0_MESFO|nr:hypothetical protein [Mesoplasma florum]AGY41387.1 hypothetical protein mflW37_3200 [Mesoplasma florum W37]AVN59609.1 hypothetical protein CG008_01670 [Mesoplasma florum]AVN65727.1 hypothetical protein MflW12_3220 [Mesoplasma florum]